MAALAHTQFSWRTPTGAPRVTIVAKATFPLAPGDVEALETPEPLWHPDLHATTIPGSPLLYPSDLVPYKARAEVVLVGAAYAPRGATGVTIRARLVVGTIDKTVFVFAERFQDPEGRVRTGPLPAHVSLGAERCIAGPDNPAGVRLPGAGRVGVLPTTVSGDPARVHDPMAAHLGPVSADWPLRARARPDGVGPFDLVERGEMPKQVGAAHFNAAPPDQQLDELPDPIVIRLEHFHPDHPALEVRLPRVTPEVRLTRPPASRTAMTCDTVFVDTARSVVHLVFRGTLVLGKDGAVPRYEVRDTAPDHVRDRITPVL